MILDVENVCKFVDPELSDFVYNVITFIKIAVPIVLVLFGMIDFGRGVIASKEDEIKKGQHNFIKRLIAGAVVFLMITVTQLVIGIIDKGSNGEIWACADDIMNGRIEKIEYAPEEDLPNGSYKETDNHKKCCEIRGGTYSGGRCVDKDGLIINNDEIDWCVLSGEAE